MFTSWWKNVYKNVTTEKINFSPSLYQTIYFDRRHFFIHFNPVQHFGVIQVKRDTLGGGGGQSWLKQIFFGW
jgi:hypothetical protein